MWFKGYGGQYVNSDILSRINVEHFENDWKYWVVRGYIDLDTNYLRKSCILYFNHNKSDCEAWAEELVEMINEFKKGV